jgi:hypothetical protein
MHTLQTGESGQRQKWHGKICLHGVLGKCFTHNYWDNFANSEQGISNDSIFQGILDQDQPFQKGHLSLTKPEEQPVAQCLEASYWGCIPYAYAEFMTKHIQKHGFACQVCKFEE